MAIERIKGYIFKRSEELYEEPISKEIFEKRVKQKRQSWITYQEHIKGELVLDLVEYVGIIHIDNNRIEFKRKFTREYHELDPLAATEEVIEQEQSEETLSKGTVPYHEYLQSEHWKGMRIKALHRDRYRCVFCQTAQNLNVHHITYERIGHEDLDDLVVLCQRCHETVHMFDIKAKKEKVIRR